MSGRWKRLYRGETTINFFGRRKIGFFISGFCLVVSVGSLAVQGLNLGLDFKGGVAFEVPATGGMTTDAVRTILEDNKVDADTAKIQTLSSGSEVRIRVQLGVLEKSVET